MAATPQRSQPFVSPQRVRPGEEGVATPVGARSQVPQFQMHGQKGVGFDTPQQQRDAEIERLNEQLKCTELELAARKLHSDVNSPALAQVLQKQTELLEQVLKKQKTAGSTIRVEPKVYWPKLGDDGPGGQEVEEFYDEFEEIFGLANNGQGMNDKEMLVTLKTCLHCSRRKIMRTCKRL